MTASAPDRAETLADDLEFAKQLIAAAAEMASTFYGRALSSELKADGTPVSQADLSVDRLIITELRRQRPYDSLLSEESGQVGSTSARRWIIDPIDGTEAFLGGRPHWGTHICLEQDGEIVLGIVSRPVIGLQWWALRGAGAFRGPLAKTASVPEEPIVLSPVATLSEARITGWKVDWLVDPLLTKATWYDCEYNDLVTVLDGRAEVMVVPGHLWDHAPFLVLLEESGGSFFDQDGGRRLDKGLAYYTNGKLDAELTALLWPHGRGGDS